MRPAALAAFVAGVFLLQQQAALPPMLLLLGVIALVLPAIGALALHVLWTQRQRTESRGDLRRRYWSPVPALPASPTQAGARSSGSMSPCRR